MGLFGAVKQAPEFLDKLNERRGHLIQYAELLGIHSDVTSRLYETAGLSDEITLDGLNKFQSLIDNEAVRLDILAGKAEPPFEIDSEEHLDWYFARVATVQHEIEDIKIQWKTRLAPLENRVKSLHFLYGKQAELFGMAQYKLTGNKKWILPHGTVSVRTEKPSWVLDDETKLQEWLATLSPDLKEEYGVTVKVFARDLDKLKAAAARKLNVPGITEDKGGDKVSLSWPKKK